MDRGWVVSTTLVWREMERFLRERHEFLGGDARSQGKARKGSFEKQFFSQNHEEKAVAVLEVSRKVIEFGITQRRHSHPPAKARPPPIHTFA